MSQDPSPQLLPLMPSYIGELLYPYGMPIDMQAHYVNRKSIKDYFVLKSNNLCDMYCEGILKQWIIYYIAAPQFYNPLIQELYERIEMSMTFDEMLDLVLQTGLDPF